MLDYWDSLSFIIVRRILQYKCGLMQVYSLTILILHSRGSSISSLLNIEIISIHLLPLTRLCGICNIYVLRSPFHVYLCKYDIINSILISGMNGMNGFLGRSK